MKHFVVYHNPARMGPLVDSGDEDDFGIVTRKRVDHLIGSRVWLLTGEGKPRKFYLASTFVVDEVDDEADEDGFLGAYGSDGVRLDPRPRIDGQAWFPQFKHDMGSFAFGLQAITDANVIAGLERLVVGRAPASNEDEDFGDVSETVRRQLIDARVGQGKFREDLVARWAGCSVTGCTLMEVLVASHIRPWKDSSNAQRLDPDNGLLLVPNLDRLFDRFLISFSDDGQLLMSQQMTDEDCNILGVHSGMRLRQMSEKQRSYLRLHRAEFERARSSTTKR